LKIVPFWVIMFHLVQNYVNIIGEQFRSGFLRIGFYPKTEVQWKLHQECDAGNNLCHQRSPAIPEASLDEPIYVPNPIHTVPTPTYVGILVLQCC